MVMLMDATTRTETQGETGTPLSSTTSVADTIIVRNLHARPDLLQTNRAVGLRPVDLTAEDEEALHAQLRTPTAFPVYSPQDLPRGDPSILER